MCSGSGSGYTVVTFRAQSQMIGGWEALDGKYVCLIGMWERKELLLFRKLGLII